MQPTDSSFDQRYGAPVGSPSLETPPTGLTPAISAPPVVISPIDNLSSIYPQPDTNIHPDRFSLFHFNRSALLTTIATVSLMALIGLAGLIFTNLNTKAKTITQPSNQYAVSNLPLGGLNANGQLMIGNGEHLTINGQVLVNSTLSATGLATLSGGATITGPTTINTTGSDNTSIGNAASTIDLNGATIINSTLVVQSAGGLTIGSGSATGKLILRNASTPALVSFQPSVTQANNLSLIVPPDINANDSLCLATLANCTAVGTPNGDLTGTYPSPTIAKLQGKTLTISAIPTTNAVLQYNGSAIVDGLITNANLQAGNFVSITGTGNLTTGSIATGFGTINTTNNITTTAAIQGGSITAITLSGGGANLTALNGTNISSGTVADARLTTNVTVQGNSFNGVSQLVQTTAGGLLPILNGSNLTNISTSSLSGTIADGSLSANVTLQGNTFNGVSQLVKTTAGGILPAISGTNLTSLNGTNISSGTLADARLSANVPLLGATTQTFTGANTFSSASNSFTGNGAGLTSLNGSNITTGTVANAQLTTNVTLQGNTFNGVSQLVQTTAGGILPVLSGANLTSLNGSNISSGTLADARLSANVPLLGATTQTFTGANTFSSASNSFTGNGAGLTSLNGTNITTGTVADARLTTNVTLQGNTFNGASQLVQLTAGGILPVLSGANLTSLNGTNISSGTVADARLTTNVTLQANTFNGVSQLVQTTAGGILPVISGTNLTSLNGTNISSGTVLNTYLVSSGSLTVTAGSGLSGGGAVALGGVITLTNSGVLSVTGTANQITVSGSTGAVTFSLPQNIAVSSSPTFAGLTVSGNTSVTGTITAGSYARSCPTGYVPVPGNPKFGTTDFCVMKYDASNDGGGNAVSVPNAAPWVNISQPTAEDTSRAAGGHLLSEAEWMTIATNALWVNANWCNADGSLCGNAPGTAAKILAAGHNDNSPAAALVASSTDSQACFGTVTAGTDTTCGSIAGTQKRTLTLSNGSVIWDIGGNVWNWTDAWIIGNEQPTVTATPGFGWREFTALTRYGDLNYANPTNRGWNSTQGLGQIYSDGTSTNNTLYGFIRGGAWNYGSNAGAFSLYLGSVPTLTSADLGFRVAR